MAPAAPHRRGGRRPDQLRGRAYLDLLLNRDSRPAACGDGGIEQDSTQASPGHPGTDPFSGTGTVTGWIPAGSAGFAANVNLTVPLTTALGLADRPGEITGFGPVDPWMARDLVRAAAASPKTTWCVTVTDQQGHATGHGCARPAPKTRSKHRSHSKRDGPGFSFTPASRDGRPAAAGPGSCGSPATALT